MEVVSGFISHVIAQEAGRSSLSYLGAVKESNIFTVLLKKGCMPDKDNLQPIYFQHSPNSHYLK